MARGGAIFKELSVVPQPAPPPPKKKSETAHWDVEYCNIYLLLPNKCGVLRPWLKDAIVVQNEFSSKSTCLCS